MNEAGARLLRRVAEVLWFAFCWVLLVLCLCVSAVAFANRDYLGGFWMLAMAVGVPLLYRSGSDNPIGRRSR